MARKTRERWSDDKGRGVVQAFEASGLSMAAFARHHGVPQSKVKYWRKKVAQAPSTGVVATRFVELVPRASAPPKAVPQDSWAVGDRVVLQGPLGWVVQVPPDHLDALIHSLASVSRC